MNLKKIILLLLLFISIKISAQVVPVIPQWKMDTSKDSLSFSIPGMSGSKWIWDSRLLRVRLLNKADSVDWYVTHTALSDTLAGHLAVAKYPVIFLGDTITVDLSGSLSPNAIISGLAPSLFISGPDTSLAISPGQWRINNTPHNKATTTYFLLPARDPSLSWYGVAYADASNAISVIYGAPSTTPVEPPIPLNTVRVGSVYISPLGYAVSGGGGDFVPISFPHDESIAGNGHLFLFSTYGNTGYGGFLNIDTGRFVLGSLDASNNPSVITTGTATALGNGMQIQVAPGSTFNYIDTTAETALRARRTAIPDVGVVRALIDSATALLPPNYNIYNHSDSLTQDRTGFFSIHKLQLGDTVNFRSLLTIDPIGEQVSMEVATAAGNDALLSVNNGGVSFSNIDNAGNFSEIITSPTLLRLSIDTLSNHTAYDLSFNTGTREATFTNDQTHIGLNYRHIDFTKFQDSTLVPKKYVVDYVASHGATFIDSETPSGTINSSNVTFTLANTPVTGSVHLYRNGVRVTNFTVSTATITMSSAPLTGDTLLADYRK